MLKNFKIASKFNLLLILIFIGSVLISGAVLSSLLEQRAQDEVTSKAEVIIQTMNSVRDYTTDDIIPLLEPKLATSPAFIPETVAAFSAIKVFENLRKNEKYKDFFYKEAAINPTNLRDKADDFEAELLKRFKNEPATKEISGYRSLPVGDVFYIARPLIVENQSCLQCHSTPQAAPKSQLATYGTQNGFGWLLHQPIATQIIYVPASKIFGNAQRSWLLVMGMLISIFAIVVIVMNLLLKRAVIKPITKMARLAQAVSTGKADSDFEQTTNDEIGILAAAFNRMKSSLEIAMQLLAQKKN
jgi:HAMP domain-containing protein